MRRVARALASTLRALLKLKRHHQLRLQTSLRASVAAGRASVSRSRFEDSKFVKGKLQFLVRFKGFPKAEWLPAAQLQEDLSSDAYRALHKAMKN